MHVSWNDVFPYFAGPALFLFTLLLQLVYSNIFIFIWIGYVLVPILDYLLPLDTKNINSKAKMQAFRTDLRFLIPLYTVWTLDMLTYAFLLYGVTTGLLCNSLTDFLVYAVCGAQVGMINITVGHELVHRKGSAFFQVTGNIPYAKALYSHFFIEHVYIHHKHVATKEDPQTARLGESLYQYYIRAIP